MFWVSLKSAEFWGTKIEVQCQQYTINADNSGQDVKAFQENEFSDNSTFRVTDT